MTSAFSTRDDILRAIATRTDNEHIADLTPEELDFAMTLEGRRLLHAVRLGSEEFRLTKAARDTLACATGQVGG